MGFTLGMRTLGLDGDDLVLLNPAVRHPVAPEPVRGQHVVEGVDELRLDDGPLGQEGVGGQEGVDQGCGDQLVRAAALP
jgi:hypothetical protein